MNYKARIKLNLMKGRTFRSRGQGIAGTGTVPRMRITSNFRQGGTISSRPLVGSLEPLMRQLGITKPKKKASKKSSKKGRGKTKSKSYKSLKFNF